MSAPMDNAMWICCECGTLNNVGTDASCPGKEGKACGHVRDDQCEIERTNAEALIMGSLLRKPALFGVFRGLFHTHGVHGIFHTHGAHCIGSPDLEKQCTNGDPFYPVDNKKPNVYPNN